MDHVLTMTRESFDRCNPQVSGLENARVPNYHLHPGNSEEDRRSAFKLFPFIETGLTPDQIYLTHIQMPQGEGETILMVDDEALLANLMSMVLRKNGYKVLAAAGGVDALAIYAQHANEIGLVLTDVMMPGMDGMDLTRALKKINPRVKVIASTGQITETRQAQFRALGVNMILSKPYDAKKLLTTLHNAIHGE
jgi:CheY-like chemotaxis protein